MSTPQTQKIRETPEDIKQEAIINTLAFHPKEDILAAGDVDGDIYLCVFLKIDLVIFDL